MSTALHPYDVLQITRRLPPEVVKLLKYWKNEVFLAGGFIRAIVANEEIADIDLIVPSDVVARALVGDLRVSKENGGDIVHRVVSTENAYTVLGYKYPVQIIHKWTYDSVHEAIGSFDFTIACAAVYWDGEAWRSLTHPNYYADVAAKRLTYLSPVRDEAPGGSMLRVLKFYQRGYRIPLESLGAVIARLTAEVRDGSRVDRATVITGLLREVDPFIDPDHIAHLPALPPEDAPSDLAISPSPEDSP